jgi:hypothetical protein
VEIPYNHSVRYTNSDIIPVGDIGRSIIGHDALFQYIPKILTRIVPGLIVDKFEFELAELRRNSPILEKYCGQILARVQESIETALRSVGIKLGSTALERSAWAVSALATLLIGLGIVWAYNRVFPGGTSLNIEGDNSAILQINGDIYGLNADDLRKMIEDALSVREKRQLERSAISIITPSKSQAGATMEVEDVYLFNPNSIDDAPTLDMLDDPEDDEDVRTFIQAPIFIVGLNVESHKTGWIGRINIDGKTYKLRMTLPSGTDLESLRLTHSAVPIIVDASVAYRPDRSGQMAPRMMEITKIYPKSQRLMGVDEGSDDGGHS